MSPVLTYAQNTKNGPIFYSDRQPVYSEITLINPQLRQQKKQVIPDMFPGTDARRAKFIDTLNILRKKLRQANKKQGNSIACHKIMDEILSLKYLTGFGMRGISTSDFDEVGITETSQDMYESILYYKLELRQQFGLEKLFMEIHRDIQKPYDPFGPPIPGNN